MSETSDDDFGGSDSSMSEVEQPDEKVPISEKRKVLQQNKTKEGSDDSSENDSDDEPTTPQPIKKRKTMQDYLNEKVISNKPNNTKLLTSNCYFRQLVWR